MLRRELIGEELLSLPDLMHDLVKAVEEMNKQLYDSAQDTARFKDDAQFKADLEQIKADVAFLKKESLARKCRERPFVHFHRFLRKPKVLDDAEVDDLISPALELGLLTENEVDEIMHLDLIVRGRRLPDGQTIYLAVGVSTKIDARDVEQVVRRAGLLEKIPGVVALPLVVGETLSAEGRKALEHLGALVVINSD